MTNTWYRDPAMAPNDQKNHLRGPGNGLKWQKVGRQILVIFVKSRNANSLDKTHFCTGSSIRYYNLILNKLQIVKFRPVEGGNDQNLKVIVQKGSFFWASARRQKWPVSLTKLQFGAKKVENCTLHYDRKFVVKSSCGPNSYKKPMIFADFRSKKGDLST